MGQTVLKLAGLLGGAAAVFYALGFTVVQTFVYRHRLDGLFFFSNEFYHDAGAAFLLDMVRAPMLAFYLFLPYLLLLFRLMPATDSLKKPLIAVKILRLTRAESYGLLLLSLMGLTAGVMSFYSELAFSLTGVRLTNFLFIDPTGANEPRIKGALLFFLLTTPLMIAGARFLYLCGRAGLSKISVHRRYEIFVLGYALFVAAIPVVYGIHLYDWKIIPVRDPNFSVRPNAVSGGTDRYYLVGEFSGKYVFLRRNEFTSRWTIDTFMVDDIKHLKFDLQGSESLKNQIATGTGGSLRQDAARLLQTELLLGGRPQ